MVPGKWRLIAYVKYGVFSDVSHIYRSNAEHCGDDVTDKDEDVERLLLPPGRRHNAPPRGST
jgi:hypothetical protein